MRFKETYVTYGQKTTKKMWQGKTDDDTQRAFADETEGKKRIPEDTFEDPDITLKACDMLNEDESTDKNLGAPLRISSGKDPPDHGPSGGSDSTDERAVRTFLHNSVKLDKAIVELIITEGGVTKLAVLKYLTVEDLLRWKTPIVMARYLIEEAVPTMLRDIQVHTTPKETLVPHPVLMNSRHVPASVMNNSPVPAHAKADVNFEHLHAHVDSSHSTVPPESDVNSSVSPTITRGNGAGMGNATSAQRLSPGANQGPPAGSTGLTPDRQEDRLPRFEVCENCSTQDQTVMTCRIDAMTLMKLCKPCANMVNTVQHGRNSSSSSSGDSSDGASVSTRSSQREGDQYDDRYEWRDPGILAEPHSFHQRMRATDLGGMGSGLSTSRAASAFVTYVQKQAPEGLTVDQERKILVNGPDYEHYMDMIPMLAVQLDDLPGGNPTDGTCVARVLRYSQKHPRISADQVPEMQRAQQSSANKALFQILLKGLRGVWSALDQNLKHGNSAIDVYRYLVSLKPCNPHGELKDLRDQVLDAGQSHSTLKAIKDPSQMSEILRTWDRKRIQYESMSAGPASADLHYQARLRDVLYRLLQPVLSKVGSLGGTLGMALESKKTLKRVTSQNAQAELTWREIIEASMDYGAENTFIPSPSSFLTQQENTDADTQGQGGKGSKGGKGGKGGKGASGGRGDRGWDSRYATIDGTRGGLCLRHCITKCNKNQCRDNPTRAASHPPARHGHGIMESERTTWIPCMHPSCHAGLQCIYKHGDGKEQIASKHGKQVQSHLAALSDAQLQQSWETAHVHSDRLLAAATSQPQIQPHAHQGPHPCTAVPLTEQLLQHRRLIVSLSQELARRLMRNKGRAAASFFTNRGMHLGQALDSGGSDHIAGQRDTGSAYAWTRMRDPIPVTTANGVVYATWECTISTLLGPMRCYYLENGGPHQSLLSVDKLCREGEYTYIHTKWGAHIIDPEGNPVNLIADGGLQYLPTVTNDSPVKGDDKLATQGQAQLQGYSTTINRHTRDRQPRLGPCDNQGFRAVLRGSKPPPPVVPRGWATPSRYAILPVDHEDTTDDRSRCPRRAGPGPSGLSCNIRHANSQPE